VGPRACFDTVVKRILKTQDMSKNTCIMSTGFEKQYVVGLGP